MPWIMGASLTALGVLIIRFPEIVPDMVRQNAFTASAIWLNVFAGFLFIAAFAFFLIDFLKSNKIESYLFSCLYLVRTCGT